MMNNIKIPYIIYPILFGIMAGWLASQIVGGIFARPRPLPRVVSAKPVKTERPADAANKVITENIFDLDLKPVPADFAGGANSSGTGSASGGTSAVSSGPPPFTAKLLGILIDTAGSDGIAVISTDNGTVSIRTGAEKNGLKLSDLSPDGAVLEKGGRKYSVSLEKGQSAAGISGKVSAGAAGNASKTEVAAAGSNINIRLDRADVRNDLKDLNKILQSALVSPFYDAGTFTGYRVTRMREDSPLKKLGLLPGDIITRVNGNELKSPELLFGMLSQIDDVSAISVDMIRNNEKKTIFVEII